MLQLKFVSPAFKLDDNVSTYWKLAYSLAIEVDIHSSGIVDSVKQGV